MHLRERGKLAKPFDIYTNGVKKKIKHYFVCIKVKQARVLQPDPRSSEDCNTLLHEGIANEGFAKECNIAFVLYVRLRGTRNLSFFLNLPHFGIYLKYNYFLYVLL